MSQYLALSNLFLAYLNNLHACKWQAPSKCMNRLQFQLSKVAKPERHNLEICPGEFKHDECMCDLTRL